MKLLIQVFTALLITMATQQVLADGTVGGGGGVVWQCKEGSQTKTYLADVAEAEMLEPHASIFEILATEGFHYVENALNSKEDGLGDNVRERLRALNFHGVTQKLKLLNDDKLPLETTIHGNHCVKAQLAVQDFSTGKISYDADIYYHGLSSADRVLFIIHETLVSLQERQFGSTAPIRAELLTTVSENILSIVTRNHNNSIPCLGTCFQIANPLEGEADLHSADLPTDAQTERTYPKHIDAPYYTCERDNGSYWLCGEGPGSCDAVYGYRCQPKPGIKQFGSEGTVVSFNGAFMDPGPDQNFYVPEDQIDKVDGPIRDPIH